MKKNFLFFVTITFLCAACSQQATDEYDICVYGASSAGIIAAKAAKRAGKSVILISPDKHLGGLTASGLGATDIGNKHAVTGLSRKFYRDLGKHYGQFESWTFEPHVAENVYNEYIREEGIEVLSPYRIVDLTKKGGWLRSIKIENTENPVEKINVKAKRFIDCSYVGDLMAMAGVSYTVGREDNNRYNESLNGVQLRDKHQFPDGIDPYKVPGDPTSGLCWGIHPRPLEPNGTGDSKVQAYNYRLCLTQDTTNRVPFSKPESYDPERYELLRRVIQKRDKMGWKQKLGWFYLRIVHMPNGKTDVNNKGAMSTDYIGGNWDYPEAGYQERNEIEKGHEQYIRGLLYFLANDTGVNEELREEMSSWGWAADGFVDNGHFPYKMYIREARRMVGEYVMTEHNCVGDSTVDDGIGLAAYTMDSHNCQRVMIEKDGQAMVKNEGDVQVGGFPPYQISYRSLVPVKQECKNLTVPVCLSASHIAYGSIRMEPVFMVMGQVAALASSYSIEHGMAVQDIPVEKLQDKLAQDPYLDGSVPDVTVDNMDSSRLEVTGKWHINSRWMGQYKSNYLLTEDFGRPVRVKFKPGIQAKGVYNVYMYCPDVQWDKRRQIAFAKEVPVKVAHAGGMSRVKVYPEKNRNDWMPLGRYTFYPNENHFIEIIADSTHYPVPADAVLLVAEKDSVK